MSEVTQMSAAQLATALNAREVTSVEVVQAHVDAIAAKNSELNVYLHVNAQEALAAAAQVDRQRADGEELPELAGVPVAVKDNIVTKDQVTTAASRMLENWIPPYDATVVGKLRAAGMPILGKTNLDEFAMGSSTEFSAFGATINPWDSGRTPGGSGGGSAVAVAAGLAPLALGSDTGGSIREPAAFTGTVGVKPTYGAVSRYGAIALASSLDQVGPAARTVLDAALLQDVLGGHDPMDSTSSPLAPASMAQAARLGASGDLTGIKVGVLQNSGASAFDPAVASVFEQNLKLLTDAGAQIVPIECPSFSTALAVYYAIMSAEASSNLARLDGMKFGLRVEPEEGPVTAERVTAASRGAGFGPEVKRRLLLGTYVLSAGNYDTFFLGAQRLRTVIIRDFAAAFAKVDLIVSPTTGAPATPVGADSQTSMDGYGGEFATIPANLAGLPALSLPSGLVQGLPVGLHAVAPAFEDARLYTFAAAAEARINAVAGPILSSAPFFQEAK